MRAARLALLLTWWAATATSCTQFGTSGEPGVWLETAPEAAGLTEHDWAVRPDSEREAAFARRVEAELWKRGVRTGSDDRRRATLVAGPLMEGRSTDHLVEFSIDGETLAILRVARERSRKSSHTDGEHASEVAEAWISRLRPAAAAYP